MYKMKKWAVGIVTTGMLGSTLFATRTVSAVEPISVSAEAAFVMDNGTNKVLLDQNGNEPLYIASMTKLLPIYLINQAVEEETISWDTAVPISDYAKAISQNYELSNVPLRQDFDYTVKDLYEAMVIYSANGATIAVSELLAGSEPAFVDLMKKQLDEWGIEGYSLYNVTGLPNNYASELGNLYPDAPVNEENKLSARGVATVADHLLDDYPEVLETAKIQEKIFMEGSGDEVRMTTYNLMLPDQLYARPAVDGLKTGTTDASGASFTGTALENDMRVITVIIGAEDNLMRFGETGRLMNYAFTNFEKVQVGEKGMAVETEKPLTVDKGKQEEVDLIYSEDAYVVTATEEAERTITTELSLDTELLNEKGLIEAPIEKDTKVGEISISVEGEESDYIGDSSNQASVAVGSTIEKANAFVLAGRWITNTVSNGWNNMTEFISGFFN
ncbi:D-alanyl-D-alanine carboxypeptidase DacA [Jeotgalibaca dankookensis]|uniref:serine-type D-Ala-D-Ala carboxypeptidase n=1 Tax=Jeotgalibaca dankookensis TaxID=708126 RepID=A0A1S6IS24_9LACT|nr:serine hydrolase [Jeotgalibaca dankookensis]AQS54324.1 D-alanyl-D-alanine carboxypeptidase DacA [Jeotgalibaca dankookensis]